jgi:hypothetical protein
MLDGIEHKAEQWALDERFYIELDRGLWEIDPDHPLDEMRRARERLLIQRMPSSSEPPPYKQLDIQRRNWILRRMKLRVIPGGLCS